MGTFRVMNLIEKLVTKIDEDGLWEKEHHLKRNQYLKVHGSKDLNLYYVLEGSVIIFLMDAGEEQIIRFGYQGDFVAALDSFISEGPSELYIRAIRATSVRSVPKSALMTVIGKECTPSTNQTPFFTIKKCNPFYTVNFLETASLLS